MHPLNGMNDRQAEAVKQIAVALLEAGVGAGSGKTKVLIPPLMKMVVIWEYPPFTNKAGKWRRRPLIVYASSPRRKQHIATTATHHAS